jgi:hypothetical protein
MPRKALEILEKALGSPKKAPGSSERFWAASGSRQQVRAAGNRSGRLNLSLGWVVDNGSSRHMTGMRSTFLSVPEKDSECHANCGTSTMHAVKGVGCVRFQLESGVSLEVAGVMYVPGLKVNLLSVSSLEDMGYVVTLEDGQVLIRSKGADTQDATVRLGIREGMLYRVSGQLVVGSKGILDCRSDHSATEVAGGFSSFRGSNYNNNIFYGVRD